MATTMNRYVIVFTIMTVLYLPPSFTAVSRAWWILPRMLMD